MARLNNERTIGGQAWAFMIPYLLYTAVASFWPVAWDQVTGQGLRFLITAAALLYFRRSYAFGRMELKHALLPLLWAGVAVVLWVLPLQILHTYFNVEEVAVPADADNPLFIILRIANAGLLVPIFEELAMRAFILEWGFNAGQGKSIPEALSNLLAAWDQKPLVLQRLPVSAFSVIFATVIFALGHAPVEYVSAIIYFLLTMGLYVYTRSLWACIITHVFTNVMLLMLAKWGAYTFLW
jgi:hypothetical protein